MVICLAYISQIQYNIMKKKTGVIMATIEKLYNTIMNEGNDRNIKLETFKNCWNTWVLNVESGEITSYIILPISRR